ncbi:predicted protein [Streptomyces sp. C]|nr:predicted protein [Streptomyces sp. C]
MCASSSCAISAIPFLRATLQHHYGVLSDRLLLAGLGLSLRGTPATPLRRRTRRPLRSVSTCFRGHDLRHYCGYLAAAMAGRLARPSPQVRPAAPLRLVPRQVGEGEAGPVSAGTTCGTTAA